MIEFYKTITWVERNTMSLDVTVHNCMELHSTLIDHPELKMAALYLDHHLQNQVGPDRILVLDKARPLKKRRVTKNPVESGRHRVHGAGL